MQEQLRIDSQMSRVNVKLFQVAQPHMLGTGNPSDAWDFLYATRHQPHLVQVVHTGDVVHSIIYPDSGYVNNKMEVEIHTILTETGVKRAKDQYRFFKAYLNLAFNTFGYKKVIVRAAENHKLIQKMALNVGFTLEGTHRKEYDGEQSVLYYGLFKEEFNNG